MLSRILTYALGATLFFIGAGCNNYQPNNSSAPISPASEITQPAPPPTSARIAFDRPKKSAHWESNVPEHSVLLAGVPLNVVINFNFDLAKPSSISITQDGKEYGLGETVIDKNLLSMRRALDPQAPNGRYDVKYLACWPDGSCHDGYFQFAIDRSIADTFTNHTNQKAVTVRLSQLLFQPNDIKISSGTTVTWTNDDSAVHYIDTDDHPAHTYHPTMNSRALKQGESYMFTFTEPGIYPYHCSAHAEDMTGSILVE